MQQIFVGSIWSYSISLMTNNNVVYIIMVFFYCKFQIEMYVPYIGF